MLYYTVVPMYCCYKYTVTYCSEEIAIKHNHHNFFGIATYISNIFSIVECILIMSSKSQVLFNVTFVIYGMHVCNVATLL